MNRVAGMLFVAVAVWFAIAPNTYGLREALQVDWTLFLWRADPSIQGGTFRVLYPPGRQGVAALVLSDAERYYRVERASLGVTLTSPVPVLVYPSVAALNTSAGLAPADPDIGLYTAGTIRLALPQSWIGGSNWRPVFQADGPVAHELGHALLDRVGHGNYPAWFNEGVAQWEDQQCTGYVWITANNPIGSGLPLYDWKQLNGNFYALPNQALAYREGLLLVTYLIQHHGAPRFRTFIHALGGWSSFADTYQTVYRAPPMALFQAWARAAT